MTFDEVASLENLCEAWQEFIRGKRGKKDVQEFLLHLSDEIVQLHKDLISGSYKHGPYHEFRINDPKPRVIHKALVRDRLLHHAIHRKLYPYFAKRFIADSFSCQIGKGMHKALNRFRSKAWKASKNHSRTCWILKCDIRKFFASVDHFVLAEICAMHIKDEKLLHLLYEVIGSFSTSSGKGIPLGNLTSQLFANIYMHPFDQFVKQELRIEYYIRYADDFVFLSASRLELESLLPVGQECLLSQLALEIHPDKASLRTVASGMDFLGWVHFPYHRVIRSKTMKRMMKRVIQNPTEPTLQSYLGMLGHGEGYRHSEMVRTAKWLSGT